MSRQINQAVNQVRLTNVAVVRLKKQGKRFEIACYRNKVENWRSGLETNIEEVLQIDRVFENVSKGVVAKNKDLVDVFGTDDQDTVCRIILNKGTSQVSDRERSMHYESMFRNVATIVSEKCVNPSTMRPYPVSTIETAMRDTIHFAVVPNRSAKQQALEVIKELGQHMPLKRAQMLVRVVVSRSRENELQQKLAALHAMIVKTEAVAASGQLAAQVLVDPGIYGKLSEVVAGFSPPGTMEVKDFSVQEDEEADVESARVGLAAVTTAPPTGAANPAPLAAPASQDASKNEHGGELNGNNDDDDDDDNDDDDASEDELGAGADVYASQVQAQSMAKKNRKKDKKRKKKEERRLAAAQDEAESFQAEKSQELNSAPVEASAAPPVAPAAVEAAQAASEPPAAAAAAAGAAADVQRKAEPAPIGKPVAPSDSGLRCSTCNVGFGTDRGAMRDHYRTDLHRVNLKLKAKSLPTLDSDEFELLGPEERKAIITDYT
mmetsp:Transcript_12747/g.32581  ORF Transcript_12747/g.32581 Transcript_12747/m.32581 type:complete len:492 (+) Transcript_12747:166-1641(+)